MITLYWYLYEKGGGENEARGENAGDRIIFTAAFGLHVHDAGDVALPPAGEYESLESQIDALLTNGAEYAAPTSGSNLQSVQMIDLDGDGSEEAVAFFRRASDKKPMKIYIFKADGDSYERYAVIEGASSQIYSVNYADLDGDGLKEILVGYKSSSDVQGLAIYPLSPGTSESLLTTGYSRYANLDMNGDGKQELLIICSDEESTARVDYYDWDDGALHAKSSLRLWRS